MDLREELLDRMRRDQEAPADIDAPDIGERLRAVDTDNTNWLMTVIDQRGWPGRGDVGEDGALAAWLIAQHADLHPEFQRRCLTLLEEAVAAGEADPGHLAYLTDRVRRAAGQPQLYGTQFWQVPAGTGPLTAKPIEDIERLDERRRAVGLGPFAEYERLMHDRNPPRADRRPA
jgi:Family of unknown function (DUF6624)